MPKDTAGCRDLAYGLRKVEVKNWTEAQRRRHRMADLVDEFRRAPTATQQAGAAEEFLHELLAASRSDHEGGGGRKFVEGNRVDPLTIQQRIKATLWEELCRNNNRRASIFHLKEEFRKRFAPGTVCVVCKKREVEGIFTDALDCSMLQRWIYDDSSPHFMKPCTCPVSSVCFECVFEDYARKMALQTCNPNDIGAASVYQSCHSNCLACGGKMCPKTSVIVDHPGSLFKPKGPASAPPSDTGHETTTSRTREELAPGAPTFKRPPLPARLKKRRAGAASADISNRQPVNYYLNNHSKIFAEFPAGQRSSCSYSFIKRPARKGKPNRARSLPGRMRKDLTLDMRERGKKVVEALTENSQRLASEKRRRATVTLTEESSSYIVDSGISTETISHTTTVTHVAPLAKRQRT